MDKQKFVVMPGEQFGRDGQYGPGDVVELTEEEARPFLGFRLAPAPEPEPEPEKKPAAKTAAKDGGR